jgi:hypothetical protein
MKGCDSSLCPETVFANAESSNNRRASKFALGLFMY